jgi:hypothetical protein
MRLHGLVTLRDDAGLVSRAIPPIWAGGPRRGQSICQAQSWVICASIGSHSPGEA